MSIMNPKTWSVMNQCQTFIFSFTLMNKDMSIYPTFLLNYVNKEIGFQNNELAKSHVNPP